MRCARGRTTGSSGSAICATSTGRTAALSCTSSSATTGFGRAAVELLLDHAFDTLGLTRVYLHVRADNAAARRVYVACGFLEEGRLRGHAFKAGRWEDVLVMGVRSDERPPEAGAP